MLYESDHIRVTAEYGTATLWLAFPGPPVNALTLPRLRELDAALDGVAANPHVAVLVVRSAKPAGFCAGLHPEVFASLPAAADRAAFAGYGQRVFAKLAALSAPSVAFLDGPCLGAGLELALACDYRLCLSRPDTLLGFPDGGPYFGGSTRLNRRSRRALAGGETLSGREAKAVGLVDHAFCERRAKIELRAFLDALEPNPRKRRTPPPCEETLAAGRRAFARRRRVPPVAWEFPEPRNPVPPPPAVIGLVAATPDLSRLAAGFVLRGAEAAVGGDPGGVFAEIEAARRRGFVTPLEADQARSRVRVGGELERAGLVLAGTPGVDGGHAVPVLLAEESGLAASRVRGGERDDLAPLRGLRVAANHRSVFFRPPAELVPAPDSDPDTLAALAAWLGTIGLRPTLAPAAVPQELELAAA